MRPTDAREVAPEPRRPARGAGVLAALVAALVAVAVAVLALAPPAPAGARESRSVLFVGDSNALSVFASVRDSPGRGWSLAIATRFGCGVVPYTAVADGVVLTPAQPLCREWEEARPREIAAQPADVALLFAGGWEQYDRWVRGKPVGFASDRWMDITVREYARDLREMRGAAGRVGDV
ncbi:MAG: SGNH hydrolase domain-containing protein, partial [bacterium]